MGCSMINYLEDGSLQVSGLWNAATNTTSTPHIAGLHDYYTPAEAIYAVSVAGSTMLGGVNTWNVGDYAYCDGEKWERIQNLADAIATPTTAGTVKPDNITTFVDSNGVISAVGGGGSGGVVSVSVVNANGVTGTVSNPYTTPSITLGTSLTGVISGNGSSFTVATPSNFPTLNQDSTGNAASSTAVLGGSDNQILYQTAPNTTSFINTATNSVLCTNSAGVPSCASILPPVNAGGTVVLDPTAGVNSFLNTVLAQLYSTSVASVRNTNLSTVVQVSDSIVMLNANNLTAYLPIGSTCRAGQQFTIQQGNFLGGRVLTQGGDFINGSISTFNLVNPFYSLSVFWNGSTFIIS